MFISVWTHWYLFCTLLHHLIDSFSPQGQLQVQLLCDIAQVATNQRFPCPPPWVWINFLEWFTGPREPVYSLDCQFITKDMNPLLVQEIHGRGPQWRSFCLHGVGGLARWQVKGFWFSNLEALWTLSFWVFIKVFLFWRDWINHWPLVMGSTHHSLDMRGGAESSNLVFCNWYLWSQCTPPL